MPRITIDIPPTILFSTELKIRISDINYGGHLSNDAVLRLCHEVRLRWLTAHGLNETDIGNRGLIMADAAIQYAAQAFYGDRLNISLSAADIGCSRFNLFYHIQSGTAHTTIAKIQTGMACFNYQTQKISALPREFKKLLEAI